MRRHVIPLVIALILSSAVVALAFAQTPPQFKLGFKTVADQISDVVGQPLEDEHYGANGDSLQQTTTGLMVWRKADNWTAFTDGQRTWINGPAGIQDRPNEERFEWEATDQPSPETSSPASAPSATPALPVKPTSSPLPAIPSSTEPPASAGITIFENGFEGGVINNNFVGWDGTTLEGSGSISADSSIKASGQYSALFNCPSGNNGTVDRAYSYKTFRFPSSDAVWVKTKFRFDGAGTSLQFGGGFLLQLMRDLNAPGTPNQLWNPEFYSPRQEFDNPGGGAYPFQLAGSSAAGSRIHSSWHTYVYPDTWYDVKMKVDYTGTYPTANLWLNGAYQGNLVDNSKPSSSAPRPTAVMVGSPWWDEASREKLYIDQVGLYTADPDL